MLLKTGKGCKEREEYKMDNNNFENNSTNYQPQMNYQPQTNYQPDFEAPMTITDWILTMILLAIPCVGQVLLLVWAFGGGANKSKQNYCRAYLIMLAIGVLLYLIAIVVLGASFASIANSLTAILL